MDFTEKSQQYVLVEFYATWCPHCHRMKPIVEQLKGELADELKVVQLDLDENRRTADHVGVDGVPTFILYRGNRELWRESGEMTLDLLLENIRAHLK